MTPAPLEGRLEDRGLPVILETLRGQKKTGVLILKRDSAEKRLYFKGGNLIFASSSLAEERLGDILLREGKISQEQYDSSAELIKKGMRQGRALVEIGALSPKELWWSVQHQLKEIFYSIFTWSNADYLFSEGDLKTNENIVIDMDVPQLTLEGIRRLKDPAILKARFSHPDSGFVQTRLGIDEKVSLEPYEKHVLALVDGNRHVREICAKSEIGDFETLKVLYALESIGFIRKRVRDKDEAPAAPPPAAPKREATPVDEQADVRQILQTFNDAYGFLYKYMLREIGPIAENVLNKYLNDIRAGQDLLFKNVKLRKDGSLDIDAIQKNLSSLRPENRREMLIGGLNEFFYAELLAIKKTLGPEHESSVLRSLQDLRLNP